MFTYLITKLPIRPLAKMLFATGGKRVKVKGEGNNTELFPLPPSPFPDLCKKSIVEVLLETKKAASIPNW
ncbi:hypothetical protein FACHB389_13195 [Nostoc calcicola FACHB-389]|nr:hypothetical protein FACHB389_13195 [Nostoc calcicola FACHB-389]